MISVMIIDDEFLLRQLVKKSVNWTKFHMSVRWEAGNGREGLELLRKYHPDIAFVDINIPYINGIELAKIVFEEKLPTRIVFLTGYPEFEYAKKAIEYRVFEYLLKPIRTEELLEVLKKLENEIVRERGRNGILLDENKMKIVRRLVQKRVPYPESEIPSEVRDLFFGTYRILVLRPDEVRESDDVQQILFETLRQAWGDAEGIYGQHCAGYVDGDRWGVLILPEKHGKKKEQMQSDCLCLKEGIAENCGHTCTIGVSAVHSGGEELSQALAEATAAAARRFRNENNTIYFWDSSMAIQEEKMRGRAQEMLECMESLSRDQILKKEGELEKFLDRIVQKDIGEDYTKILAVRLVSTMISFKEAAIGESFPQLYTLIMRCERLEQVNEICLGCMRFERQQYFLGEPQYSVLVQEGMDYICQNYADHNLSLNTIASALCVSAAYLSTLFRQEAKVTLTEYITAWRMGKAAEIMNENPGITLAELSDRVGYNDRYYFSRSFKKYYGVSPSRYRLQNEE